MIRERARHIAIDSFGYDPAAPSREDAAAIRIAKPARHLLGDRRDFSLTRIFRSGPPMVRLNGAGVGI